MVPTVSSNETSIKSQGSDTFGPHQAERKVTLEDYNGRNEAHSFLLQTDFSFWTKYRCNAAVCLCRSCHPPEVNKRFIVSVEVREQRV